MGVLLDPAEQLQGTGTSMTAAKREKGQDGGKIKGGSRVLMKLLKPLQESLEQRCIEAELTGCCASP